MPLSPEQIISDIQDLYLSDSIPWIVGYSGGKDSTASLQLIWTALSQLPAERRTFKPVYVISTDTLVENPIIAKWVELSLLRMGVAAKQDGLPFKEQRLTPEVENRFWVNLIGKGYPAPRPKFRWCTDRLKISASTKFIQNLSETNGEAILVLGTRRGESAVRDKVIDQYKGSTRQNLSRNADPKLSRVWVYAPIESWSSDDVWEYLMENPNPWGTSNQELFDIYRGATPDAECPIVVDKSTPSCGDSRFGCYVCTMVAQDKSMKAMILNDDNKSWMQPILDFRDRFLAVPDREFRDFRRMNGSLLLMNDRLVHGPYSQQRRADLLKELLIAQVEARRRGKDQGFDDLELISIAELEEIRRIWVIDKGEIEDLLPRIYEEAAKQAYPGRELDSIPLDEADLDLLRQVAGEIAASTQGVLTDGDKTAERGTELYKLTRNLLASGFRGLESRRRSRQLDELQSVLKAYAFLDEEDALQFAKRHLGGVDAAPAADEDDALVATVETASSSKVIPIHAAPFSAS
jgi:DNA sulfur modification protein DndC